MKRPIFGVIIAATLMSAFIARTHAQSWKYFPHWICNDSPSDGVPELRGTRGLDLSDSFIIAANQRSGTISIHRNPTATNLVDLITVPTVGPQYNNGPRGAIFDKSENERKREGRIFICTYDGLLCTWKTKGNHHTKTVAVIQVNHSSTGAQYLSLDMGFGEHGKPFVFVANAASHEIEQYDQAWHWIRAFRSNQLDPDYAPISVYVDGDTLYTGWAYRGTLSGQSAYICVFDLNGTLLRSFIVFNEPWGLTIAPPGFGDWHGALVICNRQNVRAYDPNSGQLRGILRETGEGSPPGPTGGPALWMDGITNLRSDGQSRIYFSMAVQSEEDGALGYFAAELQH